MPQSMQAIEPAIVKLSLMHSVSKTNHNPLISKYNIIDLIGKGTFGDIWRVFDTKTKKKYAMKTVQDNNKWSDKKRERMKLAFFKEGKKIISLNNIKSNEMGKAFIIKCKETIGSCFVMEIFGFNMEKYMKYHETNRLQISLATIRLICIQIFSAMSFIHGVGECMHCDLKPENILIDSNAKIKIIDFGNVLSFNKRLNSFNIQTLSYRAPEVLFGNHNNISSLIDMWSIGCILYQLFAINNIGGGHKRLFCSNNKDDVIKQIYHKLSPFPIYIYNKFNSLNLRNLNIYHNESNYIKLKTIRCYKLLCTLANKESDEFFYFIDLLSCLLDVNPLTRYTSEDAIRHKFIIQDSQQFNVKRLHPLIKSSNDNERQWRITHKINGSALYLKSGNCDQFPLIITKRSLY